MSGAKLVLPLGAVEFEGGWIPVQSPKAVLNGELLLLASLFLVLAGAKLPDELKARLLFQGSGQPTPTATGIVPCSKLHRQLPYSLFT